MADNRTKDKIALAVEIAAGHHKGQVDLGGNSYIFHPIEVMRRADDYFALSRLRDDEELREAILVSALLHDVIEDFRGNAGEKAELRQYIFNEFGEKVDEALYALTRRRHEEYRSYIERCAENPIAAFVKAADCWHNSQLSRLRRRAEEEDIKRREKYYRAMIILKRAHREDFDQYFSANATS